MVKLEMAMAYFVLKWKNAMINGIATPPPPTPAMLDSAIIRAKTNSPQTSRPVGGKGDLCSHSPIVALSFLVQIM